MPTIRSTMLPDAITVFLLNWLYTYIGHSFTLSISRSLWLPDQYINKPLYTFTPCHLSAVCLTFPSHPPSYGVERCIILFLPLNVLQFSHVCSQYYCRSACALTVTLASNYRAYSSKFLTCQLKLHSLMASYFSHRFWVRYLKLTIRTYSSIFQSN